MGALPQLLAAGLRAQPGRRAPRARAWCGPDVLGLRLLVNVIFPRPAVRPDLVWRLPRAARLVSCIYRTYGAALHGAAVSSARSTWRKALSADLGVAQSNLGPMSIKSARRIRAMVSCAAGRLWPISDQRTVFRWDLGLSDLRFFGGSRNF